MSSDAQRDDVARQAREDLAAHLDADRRVLAKELADEYTARFRQLVRGLFIVAAFCAFGIYTNHRQAQRVTDVVDRIQVERARNTLDSCKRTNDTNAAIVSFIQSSDLIPAALLPGARSRFPQENCQAYTASRVSGARP